MLMACFEVTILMYYGRLGWDLTCIASESLMVEYKQPDTNVKELAFVSPPQDSVATQTSYPLVSYRKFRLPLKPPFSSDSSVVWKMLVKLDFEHEFGRCYGSDPCSYAKFLVSNQFWQLNF
ncbi:hypothetical protein V6N13_114649 [Hibiscus sabdariffa]